MSFDTQTQLDLAAAAEPKTPAAEPVQSTDQAMPTHVLLDALRDHYIMPGKYRPGAVFLTEVTAPDRTHRADAVHVGLWASTFWIVAPNTRVAPPELLPPGWGLMTPGGRGRRFKVVVKAEYRDLRPTTALLAALLVSMETDRDNAVQRVTDRLRSEHYRQMEAVRREATRVDDPDVRARLKRLDALEKACGFRLEGYDWENDASAEVMGAALHDLIVEKRVRKDAAEALDRMEATSALLRQSLTKARRALGTVGSPEPEAVSDAV